jgi:uncharacterized protein YggE
VTGVHDTVSAAVEDVSARAAALSELLVELGVAAGDRLTRRSRWPTKSSTATARPLVREQRATLQVDVRVRNLLVLGRLLREAADRGRAQIQATRWIVDGSNPARNLARGAAAADARRAEAYAAGLGCGWEPWSRWSSTAPRADAAGAGRLAAAASEAVPIEAGELEVTAAVSVRFLLEP